MLLNELPESVKPKKLCKSAPPEGTHLTGQILLGDLNYLSDELEPQKAQPITVTLTFSVDKAGFCRVEGELEVNLSFICQRCLQPMDLLIKAPILVSPIDDEKEADELPAQYEPLLVTDGEIALADWIAEELYLALPLAPCHPTKCVDYESENKYIN